MYIRWLLLVPVLLLSGAIQPSLTHSGLSCVNDFITNISCVWRSQEQQVGQNCSLHAVRNTYRGQQKKSCVLEPIHPHSNAARGCWIAFDSLSFSFAEKVSLKVICNATCVNLLEYQPGHHIKLRPLDRPSFHRGNISWSRNPKPNLECEYQLRYKSLTDSEKDTEPVHVHQSFVVLDDDLFTVGDQYEAQVRVKPVEASNRGQYSGQWSDWSPSVSWTSDTGKNKSLKDTGDTVTLMPVSRLSKTLLLMVFIVLILVLIISIVVSTLCKRSCMLKSDREHVPDPSKYFQPLLSIHGGNFQKWLGHQHSTQSYLTTLSCDCNISPVEVSEICDDTLVSEMKPFHGNPTPIFLQTTSNSQSSSGFSNMGYFYSETQPGSVSLETCSVYFTYQPEEGSSSSLQSTSSYERLQCQDEQQEEPLSPDSGFGMGGEEEGGKDHTEQSEKEDKGMREECSGVNVQHLVSFVLSLPGIITPADAAHLPLGLALEPELSPWPEDTEIAALGVSSTSEALGGAAVRPSSMVVQPCSSGYLTLKEMQKYSNKSI